MPSCPLINPVWLPTLLSPIPEDGELATYDRAMIHDGRFDDFQNELTYSVYGPEGALSNQNQSAPRMVSTERKVIESHSGRRTECAEVLKQKYLNDDIQDIPRLVQGPVRYGRLHRSRSYLNLGSQDIRTQLNKIRLRMGSSFKADEDRKLDYRCSRLKEKTGTTFNLASIGELLYGTPNLDDYDPELAALFEDYVEECDNPTRMTPESDKTLRDKYVLGRVFIERVLNSETRYAFMSGFLEGVLSDEGNGSAESLDHVIKRKKLAKKCTQDPCIDMSSHVDMIKSNQDLTHKSLKEWEKQSSQTALDGKCTEGDTTTDTQTYEDPSKCESTDSVVNNKKRNVLHLGKTELDLALPESTNSPAKFNDHTTSCGAKRLYYRKLSKPSPSGNTSPIDLPLLKGRRLAAGSQYEVPRSDSPLPNPAGDATRKDVLDDNLEIQLGTKARDKHEKEPVSDYELSYSPFRLGRLQGMSGTFDSFFSADDGLRISKFDSDQPVMRDYSGRDVEDDMGIIALARKKLEHSCLSTAVFEDICKRRQEEKSDAIRVKKETRDNGRIPTKTKPKLLKNESSDLGGLDGWTTSNKHLMESDNIHMSSSELLHPVDSQETFTPTVTTANTPEYLGVKKLREDSYESKAGRQATLDRATPTSAKLSDLEDKKIPKLKFETNAFKYRSPLTEDFNKAATHVKLRLTKSSANMPKYGSHLDKAFVNVPLSKCNGYYVENDKMKPKSSVAHTITLSDRLAKQLRNIGTANEKINNIEAETKNKRVAKTESGKAKTISVTLPSIEKDLSSEQGKSVSPLDDKIALPEIKKSPIISDIEKEPVQSHFKKQKKIEQQYNNDSVQDIPRKTISVELPPISVKSYPGQNAVPFKNDNSDLGQQIKESYNHEFLDFFAPGGIPVRAEVCTSPYQFDKADPNKLIVKARSVPNSHEVCIACGSLNEKEVLQDSKNKSKQKRVHKSKDNLSRKHCNTPTNNCKWKLDNTFRHDKKEFPNIDVAKLIKKHHSSHEIQNKQEGSVTNNENNKRKSKPGNNELTFNFMGQKIRLKFESELSLGEEKQESNAHNYILNEKCKRLQEMAKPKCRDIVKNPVSRETGIYFDSKAGHNNSSFLNESLKSPSSPYVEYCKRKAQMRFKRQKQMGNELAKLTEDEEQETEIHEQTELKKFPTIPMKKNKDGTKAVTKKGKSKTIREDLDTANMQKEGLFVKTGRLPLREPEPKTKVAVKHLSVSESTCSPIDITKTADEMSNVPTEIKSE